MTEPTKPIRQLDKPEALRLGKLLDVRHGGGILSDAESAELHALLARWSAGHAAWEHRLFGPSSDKGSDSA